MIHNSLSGSKQALRPLEAGHVRMYVCGMTVYDYCHVGHARVMVAFDMIARFLRASGYRVTYVRNITDVDDKIIARAKENGEDMFALTERFIAAMHEDAVNLKVLPVDAEPRATEHMPQMIAMIQKLMDRGHAYQATGGDVLFNVRSFAAYGQLSNKNLDELRAGERVAVQEDKRDPLDFLLWKRAKSSDDPAWDAPWGAGRPGWHIECSAMSTHCLGPHFDIHGGGQDLLFPHHENEIAQSVCATDEGFVNCWVHNGFVRTKDRKMSKSLGNIFTVREVLRHCSAESLRFFILSSHYRSPLNYSMDHLDEAAAAVRGLYTALRGQLPENGDACALPCSPVDKWEARFMAAMEDDFNTPEAIAVLHELARAIHKQDDQAECVQYALCLKRLAGMLGLLQDEPQAYLHGGGETQEDERINALIAEREHAREAKDFARADALRTELEGMDILLEDTRGGTLWRRKPRATQLD